jgi:hypothetical protein
MRFDRHRRARIARLFVAVAAVAGMGVAATPALAAPDTDVSAFLGDVTIGGEGAPGKAVPLFVDGIAAEDPVATIDFSGLDGVATVEIPDDRCEVGQTTATCALPDSVEFHEVIPVVFVPVAGVADGASGSVTVAAEADNFPGHEPTTATVTVKDGIDLVAFPAEKQSAKPGDVYAAPVAFGNAGNSPAEAVDILLTFSHGVTPAEYSNCEYGESPEINSTTALCAIDGPFEVDTVYDLDPFETEVTADALGLESVDFFVAPAGDLPDVPATLALSGKGGKELKATARAAKTLAAAPDIDEQDNFATNELEVDNTFDLAVLGAAVPGEVGDTVKAKVGVKNAAAGSLDGARTGLEGPQFYVAVPAGAEVVAAPTTCDSITENSEGVTHYEPGQAGGTYYRCTQPSLLFLAGAVFQVEFGFKIKSLDAEAGAVSLDATGAEPDAFTDDNGANDTAAITLAGVAAGDDDGGTGGGLPVTGVQVGAIAGGGAALLVGGAVLLLVTRRRRPAIAADDNS